MDTSKHVFQLHGVNASDEVVLRRKLRRKEMVAFFEKLAPTVIAIEACSASHHWARLLRSFGHEVKGTVASLGVRRRLPLAGKGRWLGGTSVRSRNRACRCRRRTEPAAADRPRVATGPSQDWGCDGHLGIFAFVLWPRVDAWLGC